MNATKFMTKEGLTRGRTVAFWVVGLMLSLAVLHETAAADPAQPLRLIGSNFDLSVKPVTQRLSPSVAYNNVDNEYMVVWSDTRNPANNDIFGQRVSADGALLGANFPVIEFPDAQVNPIVAYNSIDNEYLVAWLTQQPGFFNDVRGRLVSSTDTLLGGDFFILGDDPTAGGGAGGEFSIAYNPTANEYLVTGRGRGVRGRRISSSGSLLGGAEIVIAAGGSLAPNGQVVYNLNADEYLATWRDQVAQNLQGQRISAPGTLLGNVILNSPLFPEIGRSTASVVFDPTNDRYLVVFGVFQEREILGQFISSSGQLIGTNFTIAAGLASRANPYVVQSSIDNIFLVVWREENNIVGHLLSDNGSPIGDAVVIAQGTAFGDPRVAPNTAIGEFLVIWPDNRNITLGEPDIFAQLIGITTGEVQIDINGNVDGDGDVDGNDLLLLLARRNSPATGPDDLFDLNGDGVINILDVRTLTTLCTRPRCATE